MLLNQIIALTYFAILVFKLVITIRSLL